MSEAKPKVIFTFNGQKIAIQCTTDETMESICKKCSNKIPKEMNSLLFIYEGKQVKFDLKFREQTNEKDLNENKMNILVFKRNNFFVLNVKKKMN